MHRADVNLSAFTQRLGLGWPPRLSAEYLQSISHVLCVFPVRGRASCGFILRLPGMLVDVDRSRRRSFQMICTTYYGRYALNIVHHFPLAPHICMCTFALHIRIASSNRRRRNAPLAPVGNHSERRVEAAEAFL